MILEESKEHIVWVIFSSHSLFVCVLSNRILVSALVKELWVQELKTI